MPPKLNGALAQLVEQWTENPCVPSSILGGTTLKRLQMQSFFVKKTIFTKKKNLNLILDIGNTRTKIALFNNGVLLALQSITNKKSLKDITLLFENNKILYTIMSSVANTNKNTISFLAENSELIILNSKTKIPFNNLYKTPKTLGVDRIALMAAAQKNHPNKNVLVIDAGSCITYDFINAKNEYFGGAIAPGIKMKYKAMHHFTANLPLLSPKSQITLGNSTKNAMHQGVINGTVLEIDGVINQYKKQYENLTIVLTGGDTIFLAKLLKSSIFANPNFLLEGLNYILNYNLQK